MDSGGMMGSGMCTTSEPKTYGTQLRLPFVDTATTMDPRPIIPRTSHLVYILLLLASLACSKQELMGPLYEHQYKDMKRLEPSRMTPIPSPTGSTDKVLHVRVYADKGYRQELMNWQRQIESLFGKINFLFGEAYQLRLEVESVSEWTSLSDASNMSALLAELKALDEGKGVSWVVGFVTQHPVITTGVDTLGVTNYLDKHIVLRGSNDAAGLQALHRRLDRLERSKIEALYQKRRVHQELYVFLHELGHSLGALHTSGEGIMASRYETSNSWFTIENNELVRKSIGLRQDDLVASPALARALEMSMQDADSREWEKPDIDRARGTLTGLQEQPGGQKEAAAGQLGNPEQSVATETERMLRAFESHLTDEEPGKAEQLVAEFVAQPMTAKGAKVVWAMAQGYARAGNDLQERKVLRVLRSFVGADMSGLRPDIQRLRQNLARRFYGLRHFSIAEGLLSASPENPEFTALLLAMKETRERYGVLAGSTSEDKEAEVLALILKALKLGYSGDYSRANTLLSAGQRANPNVAGILTARCDLSTRQRRYLAAAKHCARAIELYKGSTRAHYLSGVVAYHRRNSVQAIRFLEKAISLAPKSDHAWKALARVHKDAGKPGDLEKLRERYKKLNGQTAEF